MVAIAVRVVWHLVLCVVHVLTGDDICNWWKALICVLRTTKRHELRSVVDGGHCVVRIMVMTVFENLAGKRYWCWFQTSESLVDWCRLDDARLICELMCGRCGDRQPSRWAFATCRGSSRLREIVVL